MVSLLCVTFSCSTIRCLCTAKSRRFITLPWKMRSHPTSRLSLRHGSDFTTLTGEYCPIETAHFVVFTRVSRRPTPLCRYSLEIRCVQGSKILFYDSAQPLFKTQKLDHEAAHGNQGKGESQSAQPDADADADKKGLSDSQQHSITSDPPPPPTTSSLQQPIDVLEHSTHQHLQIPSFDRIVAQAISSFYQNYEPAQPPQALPSTGGADANAANAASSSAPSSFALLHPSTTRSPPVVDLHRAILCDASEEVVRPLLRLLDQAIRAAIR